MAKTRAGTANEHVTLETESRDIIDTADDNAVDVNDGLMEPSNPTDAPDYMDTPSTTSRGKQTWTIAGCPFSRGFFEFLLPAIVILLTTICAIVGVFKKPDNSMWSQLLFFVAGVVIPNPKVGIETGSSNSGLSNFLKRHYTTPTSS